MALLFTLFVACMGFFGTIVLAAVVNGYILSMLWTWFFVPLLGLPPLSLAGAMGVAIVVSFMTGQYIPVPKDEPWTNAAIYAFLRPLIVLFIGWILQHWV